MKKNNLVPWAYLLFIFQVSSSFEIMQPIKKDGRYYYGKDDTHNHINLAKIARAFCGKLISPTEWVSSISSLFYKSTKKKLDPNELLQPLSTIPQHRSIEPLVTWIGHSTFLIQINGFNILTDPIFGDVKAGLITITKRGLRPGINLEDLPPIDVIVISHNHSDHTDSNTLMALAARKNDTVVYVPEGNKALIESMGFVNIVENTWWHTNGPLIKEDKSLVISCLPAMHWSVRFSLRSYRASLWSSWMINTENINIYFAGDSAYGPHFKQIAEHFPSIDIALMPISPTGEHENTHKAQHVDAPEAVEAFIDLGAHCFIPMHYGTFFLRKDTLIYPLERLATYWHEKEYLLQNKQLLIARCGQGMLFDQQSKKFALTSEIK